MSFLISGIRSMQGRTWYQCVVSDTYGRRDNGRDACLRVPRMPGGEVILLFVTKAT
jgi:hypothetical protein